MLIPSLIFGAMTGYLLGNPLHGIVLGAIAGLMNWTTVMIFSCYMSLNLLMADPQSVLALACGFSLGYIFSIAFVDYIELPNVEILKPLLLFLTTYIASVSLGKGILHCYFDINTLLILFAVSLLFHVKRMVFKFISKTS